VRETISVDKTLDIEDNGKCFFVDTDAKVVTLPATATICIARSSISAHSAGLPEISPQAVDKIQAPICPAPTTRPWQHKATARRHDSVTLVGGDANGPNRLPRCAEHGPPALIAASQKQTTQGYGNHGN